MRFESVRDLRFSILYPQAISHTPILPHAHTQSPLDSVLPCTLPDAYRQRP